MTRARRYNLNSSRTLTAKMNDVLIKEFAELKIYQSRWFTIFVGLMKILCATVLMLLYMWHVEWSRKLNICILFVVLSIFVYVSEYGLGWLWWPNYLGTFWKDGDAKKFVVCAHSPFYSGKYQIKIYPVKSASYFQKLANPVVDEIFDFTDYFTKSGYMIEAEWKQRCKDLIKKAMIHID